MVALLAGGGDARIALNEETGLNKYFSAPHPRDIIAYSSSTISDISPEAFSHILTVEQADQPQSYEDALERCRARIAAAYGLPAGTQMVFAPSGTDLEYVALAAVFGQSDSKIRNVLLGADEIGSGCVHSARGRYFADRTALAASVDRESDIEGCGTIELVDIPVRCQLGIARSSKDITASIREEITRAVCKGQHALVHGVHGSKTGLVLPTLADLSSLQYEFESDVTFVIDACQGRITGEAISNYLDQGCIVLMTGSKFVGAPPFSGFAFLPNELVERAAPMPTGYSNIFRRAEFPPNWPGRDDLTHSANPSLSMRLEAAVFEIKRFQKLPVEKVSKIIALFDEAIENCIVKPLKVKRVGPLTVESHRHRSELPIEMRTLATIDVSMLPGLSTFEQAQEHHRLMALNHSVRLGQPVKCVRKNGTWGGTIRIGLSMPMISRFAGFELSRVQAVFDNEMSIIAQLIAHAE